MENEKKPVILVTNDDGYRAKGLKALIDAVQPFGHLVVVVPAHPQSGQSHAITVHVPIRMEKLEEREGMEMFVVTGTPADCVKLAINQLFYENRPSLLVSGINHGANSSASVVYSGTMAAVLEGCLNDIPSIGFSLLDFSSKADFSGCISMVRLITKSAFLNGIPKDTCLNVNIPKGPSDNMKGIRICRQTKGVWQEEFEKRTDPNHHDYYWLTGKFLNQEPLAEDTDEWALKNNYVSIVPVQVDMTAYDSISVLRSWNMMAQEVVSLDDGKSECIVNKNINI